MKDILDENKMVYCHEAANRIAKELMDLDVSHLFGDEGNANFVMMTTMFLTIGILRSIAKQINKDPIQLFDIFNEQLLEYMKCYDDPENLTQ